MDGESKEDVKVGTKEGEVMKQEEPVQQDGEVKQENGDSTISDELVKEKLRGLLDEADLSVVTEKMLRKSLEEQLGVKLSDKKALIRQEVLDYLEAKRQEEGDIDDVADEEQQQEAEQEEAELEPTQKRRTGGGNNFGGAYLSEQLQAFLGVESMARTQVVKALWAYIKENNLQDPKNKQKIILDEKLATLFKPPLNMLNLNQQLSQHVYGKNGPRQEEEEQEEGSDGDGGDSDDSYDGGRAGKKRAAGKAAASKRSKKARGGDGDDDDDEKPKRKTGYAKPLPVSEELAAATGESEMTRGGVVKWVYAYAREKDLFDPANKRYVLSDDLLKQLTGHSRFLGFGCQKLFSRHFAKQT